MISTWLRAWPRLPQWVPMVLWAALVLAPLILRSSYHIRLVNLVCIYAILLMGLNLLFGFTGQLSLGQQGFYAVGGYLVALLSGKLGLPLLPALVAAALAAALLGVVVGLPVLRLRGHYLAMATLAFGLLVQSLALRWVNLTGGSAGLAVPPARILGWEADRFFVYVAIALTLACHLVCRWLIRSRIGRAMQATGNDELAAEMVGIHTTSYKLLAFVTAALFSGLAGGLYGIISRHVAPEMAGIGVNIEVLTGTVLGGIGLLHGPVLGAVAVVLLPQLLARTQEYQLLVYGLLLLGTLLFLPRGLAGLFLPRGAEGAKARKLSPGATPHSRRVAS